MLQVLRTTWEAPTLDPADRVIWSWGVNGPLIDGAALTSLGDAVEASVVNVTPASGTPLKGFLCAGYRMAFHEAFDALGGPALAVVEATNVPDTVATGTALPPEVQLVVSRMINTARGLAPVGRIYVGPQGGSSPGIRPIASRIATHAEWAKALHDSSVFLGYAPEIIAKQGTILAAGKPIAAYRVDDLWDTQRRRGLAERNPASTVTIEV